MKKYGLVLLMFFTLSINVLADYEEPTEIPREENYEKVSISHLTFDKESRVLKGTSQPGSLLTIDTGDQATADGKGAFAFKLPKEAKMVIVNVLETDGMAPNSVMFDLEENRVLEEGEHTPPPAYPEIKEKIKKETTKQENKGEESSDVVIEEPTSTTKSTKKPKKKEAVDIKNTAPTSQKKETTSTTNEEDTGPKSHFFDYVKKYLLLGFVVCLIIVSIISVILVRNKKKRKSNNKKKSIKNKSNKKKRRKRKTP